MLISVHTHYNVNPKIYTEVERTTSGWFYYKFLFRRFLKITCIEQFLHFGFGLVHCMDPASGIAVIWTSGDRVLLPATANQRLGFVRSERAPVPIHDACAMTKVTLAANHLSKTLLST